MNNLLIVGFLAAAVCAHACWPLGVVFAFCAAPFAASFTVLAYAAGRCLVRRDDRKEATPAPNASMGWV